MQSSCVVQLGDRTSYSTSSFSSAQSLLTFICGSVSGSEPANIAADSISITVMRGDTYSFFIVFLFLIFNVIRFFLLHHHLVSTDDVDLSLLHLVHAASAEVVYLAVTLERAVALYRVDADCCAVVISPNATITVQ